MKTTRLRSRALGKPAAFALALACAAILGGAAPAFAQVSTLTIRVVPALVGVRFSVDGRIIATTSSGAASTHVEGRRMAVVEALPQEGEGFKADFSRWGDEVFKARRDVRIPRRSELVAGYMVSYRVHARFLDPKGGEVPIGRILGLTVRSSQGGVVESDGKSPMWVVGTRVARRRQGLEAVEVHYAVESALIEGTNAVHRAQQRFTASPDAVWSIGLLLYSMEVKVHDALFRRPLKVPVRIRHPDGSTSRVLLDRRGFARIDSLAPGEYELSAEGSGFSPSSPVSLSKNQEVDLFVVTYANAAAIAVLVIGLGTGILTVGWRRRRGHSPEGGTLQDRAAIARGRFATERTGDRGRPA